jgi:single-strand DNA-binding protein
MTTFSIATADVVDGAERTEYHAIVTWDRLAEVTGRYLGKRHLVAVEGRLQTRSWDDESGRRHWEGRDRR